MKIFKSFPIFLIILVFVILSYQNCSDLNLQDLKDNRRQGQFSVYSPIAYSSLSFLNYDQGSCLPVEIDLVEVFNEVSHICALVTNSCELNFLSSQGFSMDNNDICSTAKDVNSNSLIASFTTALSSDFGYVPDPNKFCTMQYQNMVNIKIRKCVKASNGCIISYLKSSYGFINDTFGFCN